jgi:copper chaperone CopZ
VAFAWLLDGAVHVSHLSRYIWAGRPKVRRSTSIERRETTVADVHVYVNRTAAKEGTALEDIEEALRKLDYVSHVEANPVGNVVAVSFQGGKAEQEGIKNTVEEVGYEVSRLSVRSTIADQDRNLWDI